MPASKKKELSKQAAPAAEGEARYPTEKLLKSRHLAEYQRDFAGVLLKEKEYTIAEARNILDKALRM